MRHIPNALTLLRGFVITPLIGLIFIWYVLSYYQMLGLPAPEDYFAFRLWPLILAMLAIITDVLDGYLAKTYGWKSAFGARVDPLMDKFFSYTCLACVPMYYGLGLYVLWFVPFAYKVDVYSRRVTKMRRRKEILEANEPARLKTGYLFAAQLAFMLAIASEDTYKLFGEFAVSVFGYFAFAVAGLCMMYASILCDQAMKIYEEQAARQRDTRPSGAVAQAAQ